MCDVNFILVFHLVELMMVYLLRTLCEMVFIQMDWRNLLHFIRMEVVWLAARCARSEIQLCENEHETPDENSSSSSSSSDAHEYEYDGDTGLVPFYYVQYGERVFRAHVDWLTPLRPAVLRSGDIILAPRQEAPLCTACANQSSRTERLAAAERESPPEPDECVSSREQAACLRWLLQARRFFVYVGGILGCC